MSVLTLEAVCDVCGVLRGITDLRIFPV